MEHWPFRSFTNGTFAFYIIYNWNIGWPFRSFITGTLINGTLAFYIIYNWNIDQWNIGLLDHLQMEHWPFISFITGTLDGLLDRL